MENEGLADERVPEFQPENTVCSCTIHPDGSISSESYGLLFDGVPLESDFSKTPAKDRKWLAPRWDTEEVSIGYNEFSRDFVPSVLGNIPVFLYATEDTDLVPFLGQGETEEDYISKARERYGLAEDFEGSALTLFVLPQKIYELKTAPLLREMRRRLRDISDSLLIKKIRGVGQLLSYRVVRMVAQ